MRMANQMIPIRWALSICLMASLSACADKNTPAPTQASAPAPSGTEQVLTGLADSLGSLKDQLQKTRETLDARDAANAAAGDPPETAPTPGTVPAPSETPPASASTPTVAPSETAQTHLCRQAGLDSDGDGLSDACESEIAEQFAPVFYHSSEETSFPISVDSLLSQSALSFFDDACRPDLDLEIKLAPSQQDLIDKTYPSTCGSSQTVFSNQTRSKAKSRTFYLKDLPADARESKDASDWITYVHVYPNTLNGATVQYWRLHPYNGRESNGGDWKGVHVVLNSRFQATQLLRIQDQELVSNAWNEIEVEGERAVLYLQPDNHQAELKGSEVSANGCKGITGFFRCRIDLENPETFVRHESWKDGTVSWFDGSADQSGGLLNVGERTRPMNKQVFIQYAGLWGSLGRSVSRSGDWGPAYHGVEIQSDGFLRSWAENMRNPSLEEAYPTAVSP